MEEIEKLIKDLRISLDRDKYKDLYYNVYEFAIIVWEKRQRYEISNANMEMKKAQYQVANRDKYNSDRTASSHFKIDNAESINKLEVFKAELSLLETKLKRYDNMLKHFNWDEIRSLALNKRMQEVENNPKF